ncbi:MAG: RNA-binding protein [Candidatus Cyclonatronum sp.]|uniref:RNA recognition motif domain-containing protein n=1 Tax=Cyclonatronum sp. TaxID=3024185 RepID=UPI0025C1A83E|nr:RNA-binding protein [Cyclonatronum sp.]MCC5933932.1 RNA-binding protein [Balneolales bacterium]MCH8486397.1 RNA-binding protein [Cyclonatronum sp.]
MTLYVGNLNYRAGEQELSELFSAYGEVKSVSLISDKFTGRSKGFAFVEMDDDAGNEAIAQLHDTEFMDRSLVVNEARPRESRDFRGPRQGGGGGGSRGGNGGGGQRRNDRGGYGGGGGRY